MPQDRGIISTDFPNRTFACGTAAGICAAQASDQSRTTCTSHMAQAFADDAAQAPAGLERSPVEQDEIGGKRKAHRRPRDRLANSLLDPHVAAPLGDTARNCSKCCSAGWCHDPECTHNRYRNAAAASEMRLRMNIFIQYWMACSVRVALHFLAATASLRNEYRSRRVETPQRRKMNAHHVPARPVRREKRN